MSGGPWPLVVVLGALPWLVIGAYLWLRPKLINRRVLGVPFVRQKEGQPATQTSVVQGLGRWALISLGIAALGALVGLAVILWR